jgi:O-antigen/teichoic acid export membrane protein
VTGRTGATAAPRAGPAAGSAVRGSVWTVGGYAAGQLIRLGGNLVLTRLLFPAVFGQMALVTVFMQGLQMFSDVGTGPAIVQSRRGDDPAYLDTAWTIQCIRGALLWLCSWAVASPLAAFFSQPLLTWLIPAAGFSALLGGLEATSMHTLQRHLRLERLTVVEVVSQSVGVAAAVVGALVDRRVYGPNHAGAAWVFVGANLLGSLARLAMSHLALPGIRHHFRLERAALTELMSFGRWVFVSTLLTFLAGQADRLVFGKLIPLDLFGVYGIAAALAMLPTLAVLKVGSSVAFPAYARLAAQGGLGPVLGRVRLPLLLGGGAIVSGLFACGPGLIDLLYDDRYAQAGWILRFLAASAWFQIMEATCGAALLAMGRVPWMAAGSAAKLACLVLLIPLGFHLDGFRGALVGLVAAEAVKYLVAAGGVAVVRMPGLRLDAGMTALVVATSVAGLLTGGLLDASTGSRLAAFVGAGLVSGGAWLAILGWYLLQERARRAAGVAPAPGPLPAT